MNTVYLVNKTGHNSFTAAVKQARFEKTVVTETATGRTCWSPAPPVSKAKMQNYIKRLCAYRNTHRLALMELETIRELRKIDGNIEEVNLLNGIISERIEYIEKIQNDIDLASGKGKA